MTDLTTPSLAASAAFALPHLGVIRASGADAADFLHNQLTQDIKLLGADQVRLAGYCSVKGRLLASFLVLRPAADEVLLIAPRSVLAGLVKRLSMFVLRAKVKLAEATDLLVAGQWLDQVNAWQVSATPGGMVIGLPTVEGVARTLLIRSAAGGVANDENALRRWQWLEVRSGVALLDSAVADAFVPQMLNFDAIGGVNFKKGCYPGQEVVARSQYRGTLKRRGYLLHSSAPMPSGAELFSSADPAQPSGQVAMCAPRPDGDGFDAFAEMKVAMADGDGTWHVGAPDGPVATLLPLPYVIPAQD